MRIFLTGATGRVGGALIDRLANHGHDVTVVGRRPDIEIENATYRQCDVTDFDRLLDAMRGHEGVIHLAAIPDPLRGPGRDVFDVNCLGTFNVFEAAAELGIGRVVVASSINALGQGYALEPFVPDYFPLDEDHPTHTREAYGFSKIVTEEIAAYFWRREGIRSVCLRIPGVRRLGIRRPRPSSDQFLEALDRIAAKPEAERIRWLNAMHRASRTQRYVDHGTWWGPPPQPIEDDSTPLMRGIAVSLGGFWTAIDARDSAQAFEKALLADIAGSHTLFVQDAHNTLGIETERLLRVCFPTVHARTRPIRGCEGAISNARAHEVIGYAPEFSIIDD